MKSLSILCLLILTSSMLLSQTLPYPIVGTAVSQCFGNTGPITCPTSPTNPFFGQFPGIPPSFHDNGNGTITDLNTGLTWQSSPDANGNANGIIEKADKLNLAQVQARPAILNAANYGGYSDWRVPTIKELYSLTNWNGTDPNVMGTNTAGLVPFIDTTYFPFAYGQVSLGERIIDSQYASGTVYKELGWDGFPMLFGYNFADGRIKGYGLMMPGGIQKTFFLICVRGNSGYGINVFKDNGDNTISDKATGLMWTKEDSHAGMNWQDALAWAQTKNAENFYGYHDWRLPDTKELQSIVDYARSPKSTNSAAIDTIFQCSRITDEAGNINWPWYWSSTTHQSYDGVNYAGANGIYVCFGAAFGWMMIPGNTYFSLIDVHGAGAQRSSPKNGTYLGDSLGVDSLGNAVYGRGPQGDVLRVNNYVRLVRSEPVTSIDDSKEIHSFNIYPNPVKDLCTISTDQKYSAINIRISNSLGIMVKELNSTNTNNVEISTSDLPHGVYFINISTGNSSVIKKIIKL